MLVPDSVATAADGLLTVAAAWCGAKTRQHRAMPYSPKTIVRTTIGSSADSVSIVMPKHMARHAVAYVDKRPWCRNKQAVGGMFSTALVG